MQFVLIKANKILKRIEELWIEIRDLIRSIIKNSDDNDYDEKYIKVKFDLDDELL